MNSRIFVTVVLITCLLVCPLVYAGGVVNGTISLKLTDNQVVPAAWVRILLVQSPVTIPVLPGPEKMNPYQRMETIRDLHMKFFIAVRQTMSDPEFVIQSALTTPEGLFQFPGVLPGDYHLIVTFPAMVNDRKVAWQIPVTVMDDQSTQVELSDKNLLMPTYSR